MFNEMESRFAGNTSESKRLEIYLCNALNVKNDIISRFKSTSKGLKCQKFSREEVVKTTS